MKAEMYKIKICDSILDRAHGFTRQIEEYYIPKLKVAINLDGNLIHCFETDKDRYKRTKAVKIWETAVPTEVIEAIKKYIGAKKELEIIEKWVIVNKG